MADTPIAATVGVVTRNGHTVTKVHATQLNDSTHVATNPDQGRVLLRSPQGYEYTSTPTVVVSTSAFNGTLIKEAQ